MNSYWWYIFIVICFINGFISRYTWKRRYLSKMESIGHLTGMINLILVVVGFLTFGFIKTLVLLFSILVISVVVLG